MTDEKPLSIGEFSRWSKRTDIVLGRIEDKQDKHGERIAALEGTKKQTRKTASGWSAGIAGLIMGVFEVMHRVGWLK